MAETEDPTISLEQAQQIINKHFPKEHQFIIAKLIVLENQGYSHTPGIKTYVADLQKSSISPPAFSCFVTITRAPTGSGQGIYRPNSLPLIAQLLDLIRTKTGIPIRQSILDTSLSLVPYHCLLSPPSPFPSTSIISLPHARASGHLSPTAILSIDLLLGQFLGQLHSGVQNEWFGLPQLDPTPPTGASFSWQETFTALFEDLLTRAEAQDDLYIPHMEIRRLLARAIASFLFDDVEVPALVWFTGSEHDIYITLPSSGSTEPGTVAAILPNLAHALWGDPLLEAFMMEKPTKAFLEGYKGGGGEDLLLFKRQGTKRIWYTVFMALLVLTKYGPTRVGEETWIGDKRTWAKEALDSCVTQLQDAPCY